MLTPAEQAHFISSLGYVEPNSRQESLVDWLTPARYGIAFYKAWLLLVDTVALPDLIDRQAIPRLKHHHVDGKSVATRHWYKTASCHQHCPVTNEQAIPVRLPGHFSVRGDWFLAVAGGSRSERLARRAIDLFSTRRANFRRMELGIGLPTRDIASGPDMFNKLPTALVKQDDLGRTTAVTYGELTGANVEKTMHFSWLWRSQLRDYHRHSRVLQRWIAQMIAKWDCSGSVGNGGGVLPVR